MIGIWGPAAREALAAVTGADVSNETFPFRTARTLYVGSASVLAQRITYVGELGYELYTARRDAVQVWDALMTAASPEPVGYAALDSLRIEKGYRYFGADLTSSDTPFEAGLGFCVAQDKRPELDRCAGTAAPDARRRRRRLPDDLRRRGGAGERRPGDRARAQCRLRLHRRGGTSRWPSCRQSSRRARRCTSTCFGELVARARRSRRAVRPRTRARSELERRRTRFVL